MLFGSQGIWGSFQLLAATRRQGSTSYVQQGRCFKLDRAFMEEYNTTIRQYTSNDHAKHMVNPKTIQGPLYYMPHHVVVCRDRKTTKVRTVYKTSSKAPGSLSLNKTLHSGSNLNPDVPQMLLQF